MRSKCLTRSSKSSRPSFFTNFPCIRVPWDRSRSTSARILAAASSSSDSRNSRSGTRPLGSTTYSMLNSTAKSYFLT